MLSKLYDANSGLSMFSCRWDFLVFFPNRYRFVFAIKVVFSCLKHVFVLDKR
jgi:hypothetical protein